MLRRLIPPAKPAKFAKLMIRALEAAGHPDAMTYDAEGFRLVADSDSGIFCFLHNAYGDYCRAPMSMRRKVIEQFAQAMTSEDKDAPKSYADAKPRLWPNIHHRSRYEGMKLVAKTRGLGAMDAEYRVVADCLALAVVHNGESSMQTIGNKHLADWGVTFDEALEVAKANMWKASNANFKQAAPSVWLSPWQDNLDASRMALPDLIWQLPVKGNHVAFPVTRDVLLVTGADDCAGIEAAAGIAQKLAADGHVVSIAAYELRGREWAQFQPTSAHSASKIIRKMRLSENSEIYAQQAQQLNELVNKGAEDSFVAQFFLFENTATSELSSACSWADGVDTLLPVTERIMFGYQDDFGEPKIANVPWDAAQTEFGELMEQTDYWPVRYRVRRFPPLERIKAIATLQ